MDYRLDTVWNPNVVCDPGCWFTSYVRVLLTTFEKERSYG